MVSSLISSLQLFNCTGFRVMTSFKDYIDNKIMIDRKNLNSVRFFNVLSDAYRNMAFDIS